jgi:uncharacterized membrane protein YfcA
MSSSTAIESCAADRDLRRRTLVFSLLGLIACIVLAAAFEMGALGSDRAATMDVLMRLSPGSTRLDMSHAPTLVSVGVFAGLLAGMLGMGGGVLKVAGMLVVFQMDILLARAVSLTTMFLATISAASVHLRKGAVLREFFRPMIMPAIVGVLGGMFLGSALPRATLTHLFAFFALFLALNTLGHAMADPNEFVLGERHQARKGPTRGASRQATGGLHGFVCGLLGISGGVVAVPMQQALMRVPARHAVANSVVVSAYCTGVGAIAAVVTGVAGGDFQFADVVLATMCIGGGAVLGAQLGARLTGVIRASYLKLMFVQVCLAAGVLILFK